MRVSVAVKRPSTPRGARMTLPQGRVLPKIAGAKIKLLAAKRHLRVLKWIGTIPAVAVCTGCERQFTVPLSALKRVADAQQSLRVQFAEHDCQSASGNG